ncbi:hypothetical protein JCM10212_005777, partial [Sporobolomyces blumeae]
HPDQTLHRPSPAQAASLRARLLTNLASYDTLSKRLLTFSSTPSASAPSKPGAAASGPEPELTRLQRALGTKSKLWLSDKLSMLRSLGTVEELSGPKRPGSVASTASDQSSSGASSARAKSPLGRQGRPGPNGEGLVTAAARDGTDDRGRTGVKSLESLLSRDELNQVRRKVGQVVGIEPAPGSGVHAHAAGATGGHLVVVHEAGDEDGVDQAQLAVLLEQERLVASYLEDANSRRQFEDAASLSVSLDELRKEIERVKQGKNA